MKSFLVAALLLAGFLFAARAQPQADDKYIGIYGMIQQADHLADTGDAGEALAAYADAQNLLQKFQKMYPNWNPNIVTFRLNLMADKMTALRGRLPVPAASPPKSEKPAAIPARPEPVNVAASADLDNLRTEMQSLQAANESLEAKLKEALSVQPAAVDPRELARVQERVRWLMKENDLLKASHGSAAPVPPATQFITNLVKVFVTNNPVVVTNIAQVFAKSLGPVVVTNFVRVLVPDTNALEMARLDYAAAVKNFNDEHARAEQLLTEMHKLRQGSGPVGTNDGGLAALRGENTALKGELATLRQAAPPAGAGDGGNLTVELKQARARIATLQSEMEIVALEKRALENKLRQFLTATNASAGAGAVAYEARIRELTQERNNLIERLDAANKQKAGGKNSELTSQLAAVNLEVATLRSRLAVAEAQPVPYTAEELALFQSRAPGPAAANAGKKSIKEMPAGTAELVASAQGHFVRQEYDQAEADYQKILERDQNNGIALANLATIEMQQGKLDDAEKHITAALAQGPNDPFNLSALGYLRFRQEKYPEALNALSRAAQLDPNNAEIQNYLGVTLSHQGQRKQAETALRKAIQLSPGYAPAHNNLAVLYLGQTPPLAGLARWHYQKALEAGQPRNSDLEILLAEKGAPVQ